MMNLLQVGTAATLTILSIACSHPKAKESSQSPVTSTTKPIEFPPKELPFTKRTGEVLRGATAVEARRMAIKFNLKDDTSRVEYGPIVALAPATADRFRKIVSDPRTYLEGVKVLCFNPGVQLEFIEADKRVVVQICFRCGNLRVALVDKSGEESMGTATFSDEGGNQLGNMVREIFPNDPDFALRPDSK